MKFNFIQMQTMVVTATICCLFSGCTSDGSKKAVYEPIEPAGRTQGIQVVGASNTLPLSYQWYKNTNSDEKGQPFSVQAVGGTNGALFYQWYFNANDETKH